MNNHQRQAANIGKAITHDVQTILDVKTRIYLRGDKRVHLLRILSPDDDKTEGVCGLQGILQHITDDAISCDDCTRWVAQRGIETVGVGR